MSIGQGALSDVEGSELRNTASATAARVRVCGWVGKNSVVLLVFAQEPGKNPYEGDFTDLPWPNWVEGKSTLEIAKVKELAFTLFDRVTTTLRCSYVSFWHLPSVKLILGSLRVLQWQERELIHARWAMMGCAGAWGAEVGTGVPWFKAGALCTPDDCTAMNTIFPGQVLGLAPEGSGFPNFYAVLAVEVVAIGLAEAYRTGLIEPCFPELEVGDLHPGGEHFDPLGLGSDPAKLEEYKVSCVRAFTNEEWKLR